MTDYNAYLFTLKVGCILYILLGGFTKLGGLSELIIGRYFVDRGCPAGLQECPAPDSKGIYHAVTLMGEIYIR